MDDGPRTIGESLDYARSAVDAGTELIVATPHVEDVDVAALPERLDAFRVTLKSEGIPLRVLCGGELKPASVAQLSDEELDVLAHGPPGARWVLLEVPFAGFADELHDAADELRARGFTPLLAHPERAEDFGTESAMRALDRERRAGAAIQMNVAPLAGLEREPRARAARELLGLGIASAMGSDAHPPRRPYTLATGEAVAREAGASRDEARRLVSAGPRDLLERGLRGRAVHAPPPLAGRLT